MLEYASMRIVGGKFKGKSLIIPNTETTRPTADLVKTSLFNILQWQIEGTKVLDLFAGSGALGLEAVSRNAKLVYFVEKDKQTFNVLKTNASIAKNVELINSDFLEALSVLSKKAIKFDIVFLDPPYNSKLEIIALDKLIEFDLLETNAIIVVEQDADLPNIYSNLRFYENYDIRKYGRKKLYFLKLKELN